MRSKTRQIEEQDAELLKLHERNGDLGLEVQNLKEQLAIAIRDREESLKSSPASDLSDKAAKVLSFIKTLLPVKTRLPSNTMSKLEEILGED